MLETGMTDFLGYQKGAENTELIECHAALTAEAPCHKTFLETWENVQKVLLWLGLGGIKLCLWISLGLRVVPALPSTQRAATAERRGGNCCFLPLYFPSSSLKITKYRNPIIFDDVPVITMQAVKMLPQTPKWAGFLLNCFRGDQNSLWKE